VVFSVLPNKLAYKYARLEPYGFIILLALILLPRFIPGLNLIGMWLSVVSTIAQFLLSLVIWPLNLLLA
jgi:hypothetical protein